jgi:DNA ligase D-like protein (predicted 3'-phosphoesterase)
MAANDFLKAYREKRDFRKTSEPTGNNKKGKSKKPMFVIQRHDASREHYDFRLEIDGVLKSWAVPKGLSLDPSDKRLAIETEDHPIEYGDFEGVIPEGEYGAGTVMVWDTGYFRSIKKKDDQKLSPEESYAEGRLEVFLDGEKIKGGFALVKTRMQGGKQQWLLIKMKGDHADARRNPVSTQPNSVKTWRTLKQIENEEASD